MKRKKSCLRVGLVLCLFIVVVSNASEDLAVRHERLKRLYEVSKVLHSSLEIGPALDIILEQAMKLTRASSASVALVNPTTGLLEIEAGRGLPVDSRGLCLRVARDYRMGGPHREVGAEWGCSARFSILSLA